MRLCVCQYTPVVATPEIHICAKFSVDCSSGASSIVNITDRQTDTQMKNCSESEDLPKFESVTKCEHLCQLNILLLGYRKPNIE